MLPSLTFLATERASMDVTYFDIENGPVLMTTKVHQDDRGCFYEGYHAGRVREALGFEPRFVQDNVSRSSTVGTLRGLHLQMSPHAQGKFIQCLQGEIWDVAVDARPDSQTYGKTISVTLAQNDGNMFWVPPGFLHGFITRSDDVLVTYKVTAHYAPKHDMSVAWNDPELNIDWGVSGTPILSMKDAEGISLSSLRTKLEAST